MGTGLDPSHVDRETDLYLSIAFLKECNLACDYCHPWGESKMANGTNLTADEMKSVIDAAVAEEIRTFRFTGGECTLVPWFEEVLRYTLGLDPDINVNICTNGTTLQKHLELLEEFSDRLAVRISLDSIDPDYSEMGFDKVLTPELQENLEALADIDIRARFNTVVTQKNVDQVEPIIEFANRLGLNVKLLDLYTQDKYIATHGKRDDKETGLDPAEYWKNNYVDLTTLVPQLEEKADRMIEEFNRDGGFGIPMYAFDMGDMMVIFKDSTKGAYYNGRECIENCDHFGTECQEGMYTPHVSSNMVLHVSGCRNTDLRWGLRDKGPEEQRAAFDEALSLFENLTHVPDPPDPIQYYTPTT